VPVGEGGRVANVRPTGIARQSWSRGREVLAVWWKGEIFPDEGLDAEVSPL